MSEKGYKGGLVSRVRNAHSGKRYVISTAQELGKDYWTINVFPGIFFGYFPKVTQSLFAIVRNNKESAHEVHWEVKKIVSEATEASWFSQLPDPQPPEGYSPDAVRTLKKKLGHS